MLLILGCFMSLTVSAKDKPDTLADSYYRGDGLGYNVSLVLETNGEYRAWWDGCLGRYGTAKGYWKAKSGKVELNPSEEIDMMKGHLRILNIRKIDGRFELLPEEDEKRMKTEEEKRMFSFTKIDRREKASHQ
ncbi:MAG TPA: hypothetical protein VIM71_00915 [Lacunisphaera sp.]